MLERTPSSPCMRQHLCIRVTASLHNGNALDPSLRKLLQLDQRLQAVEAGLQDSSWVAVCQTLSTLQQLTAHHSEALSLRLCDPALCLSYRTDRVSVATCCLPDQNHCAPRCRLWRLVVNVRMSPGASAVAQARCNPLVLLQKRGGSIDGEAHPKLAQPTEQGRLSMCPARTRLDHRTVQKVCRATDTSTHRPSGVL